MRSNKSGSKLTWREGVAKPCFRWLEAFGFNPLAWLGGVRGLGVVCREYFMLRRQNRQSHAPWRIRFAMPCLSDRFDSSGSAGGHYFHQDLLIARRIFERNPKRHVDIGSRVDGFVAHVASFRNIEVCDIRPLPTTLPSIVFRQMDLLQPPPELREYCDSLSCLHALEHFGLGRYGDGIDVAGHLKGLANITLLLQVGGTLYLSLPIGPERIDFNANRVFAVATVLEMIKADYTVERFDYVDDGGALHLEIELSAEGVANNFGCQYGCGIFELRKR